ncbi:MAG TPA: NADPH:quinone reductase [Burkholderiaceae bacterium]|nr:NADPH:quinone reductase [Burkholderiaceae bacterium]
MQAAFYEHNGPAAQVLRVGDVADPVPSAGELRVRLRWSGVNPSDTKSRTGRGAGMPFPRVIPHSDGMGVVDAVGDGVARDRIGQRVWVWNAAWGRPFGTAAQSVVLPAAQAVVLPDAVPDEVGACLGIPGLTAMHAVLAGDGVAGKRVLVAGGAGAVGHAAVQCARLLGARQVLATVSSPAKAVAASAAGADVVIDYKREDVAVRVSAATLGQGVDRIVEVDVAANAMLDAELLRTGGDVVVYGSGAPNFSLPFFPLIAKNLALRCFIVYHLSPIDRQQATDTLLGLLSRGRLDFPIAHRVPLAEIVRAHELVEQGQAMGNVVVQIP